MLRLQCTFQVENRDALSAGKRGRDKAVKAVISLQKSVLRPDSTFICFSTAKNVGANQYAVTSVKRIMLNFLHEGKLTLILNEPSVNVMISHAVPRDLERLVQEITGDRKITPIPISPPVGKENPSKVPLMPTTSQPANANRAPSASRKRAGAEIKEREALKIKKTLKAPVTSLKVKRMSAYPTQGFNQELKEIILNDVHLKRVDSRLLKLANLQKLDLSNNRITSVDVLTGLGSQLRILTVNSNRIESISADFFTATSMKRLEHLSLNDNELTVLPKSIVSLGSLVHLSISNNKLAVLPYNMHFLKRLVNFEVDGNQLTFLPHPLTCMTLNCLNISKNQLPIPRGPIQSSGVLKHFPTLFELTANFVANYNDRKYAQPTKTLQVTPSEIPRIACDMVESCKRCSKCGVLSCRYILKNQRTRVCAHSVISDLGNSQLPTKIALCEKCSLLN